jgi:hypothetical protein
MNRIRITSEEPRFKKVSLRNNPSNIYSMRSRIKKGIRIRGQHLSYYEHLCDNGHLSRDEALKIKKDLEENLKKIGQKVKEIFARNYKIKKD